MFATLFQRFIGDALRRPDLATFERMDEHLLRDVGLTRFGVERRRMNAGDIAASSMFPVHDVWSKSGAICRLGPDLQ